MALLVLLGDTTLATADTTGSNLTRSVEDAHDARDTGDNIEPATVEGDLVMLLSNH